MHLRLAVSSLLLATVALAAGASAAGAAAHGATIRAIPNPSLPGEPVLIYGKLSSGAAGQQVVLRTLVIPPRNHHGKVASHVFGTTTTGSSGFYEFQIPANQVTTNRVWVAVARSAHAVSKVILQHVDKEITVAPSTATGDTQHAIVFSGRVLPGGIHQGEPVYLETQAGDRGYAWHVLARTTVDNQSRYSISFQFRAPGVHDLRVFTPASTQNGGGLSDVVTVAVQQPQNASFTIAAASSLVAPGQKVSIGGTLYKASPAKLAAPVNVPEPGVGVALWARSQSGSYAEVTQTTTDPHGSYSFTETPQSTSLYVVRTVAKPLRVTTQLAIGVAYSITLSGPSRAKLGRATKFTGHVSPEARGHAVYLQIRGPGGIWNAVAISRTKRRSRFHLVWRADRPGTQLLRVIIPGGPSNASGQSKTITVKVAVPGVQSLP